jgi:hypothetical protein
VNVVQNVIFLIVDVVQFAATIHVLVVLHVIWQNVFAVNNAIVIHANAVLIAIL